MNVKTRTHFGLNFITSVLCFFAIPSSVFSEDAFLKDQPSTLRRSYQYLGTNPDSAFYFAINFIENRSDSTPKQELCFAYYLAGSAEYLFGDLSYSDSLSVNSLKIAANVTNEHLLGLCEQLYAKILKVEKRFEGSMVHLLKEKEHFEKDIIPFSVIESTIDFAEFYRSTANFSKALQCIN